MIGLSKTPPPGTPPPTSPSRPAPSGPRPQPTHPAPAGPPKNGMALTPAEAADLDAEVFLHAIVQATRHARAVAA